METTRLSTKGQIVLPHAIGVSRSCGPGTEFTVEVTSDGILLRPAASVAETDLDRRSSVVAALTLTEQGIDLADAIHFCSRPPGVTFVSFDRSFVRRAKRAGTTSLSILA